MPKLTIGYGIALILLGLLGYFGTGGEHLTSLIPSMFGAVLLILGLVGLKPNLRKHAMHGAAAVSLLAVLAPLGRIIPQVSKGAFDITRPAPLALVTMLVLSVIFLVLCVRSFIAARRARTAGV